MSSGGDILVYMARMARQYWALKELVNVNY
jgi:hypothetical protein